MHRHFSPDSVLCQKKGCDGISPTVEIFNEVEQWFHHTAITVLSRRNASKTDAIVFLGKESGLAGDTEKEWEKAREWERKGKGGTKTMLSWKRTQKSHNPDSINVWLLFYCSNITQLRAVSYFKQRPSISFIYGLLSFSLSLFLILSFCFTHTHTDTLLTVTLSVSIFFSNGQTKVKELRHLTE